VITLDPPTFKTKLAAPAIDNIAMPMTPSSSSGSIDPNLLRVGRDMYGLYCKLHPDGQRRKQPIGVAINKLSHRGKLIFSSFPILLPEECFIPIQELDGEF
jgi:hypothetical protein